MTAIDGARVLARGLVAIVVLSCVTACEPQVTERIFPGGRLGMVSLVKPQRTPDAMVFVFSDLDGWDAAYDGVARTLARHGAVVVGVDLSQYLRNLAASTDGCHYVVAEIEDMSKRLQRDFLFAGYRSPILAGVGAGGALAYAALAQSPAVTVAGAVSVDPATTLGTKVPLCAGAPARAAAGAGFSYGPYPQINGWWRVSAATVLPAQLAGVVEQSKGVLDRASGTPLERLLRLVETALPAPAAGGPLSNLPLTVLPAARPGPAMAVFYSGDGGWRDIDKQIGEILSREGMPVIGVDSLRYFWKLKTPAEIANDLSQIIRHYAAAWGADKVVLIGYSFGAGILPFAVNQLPSADRARIVQISLLGLEPRAEFEVKLSAWVGGEPGSGAAKVLPEILRQRLSLFQCVYGVEEKDSLCRAAELAGAEIIQTAGGHHFDGNYPALARKILDGVTRRMSAPE